jgi:hypothetical protein
MPSSWRVAWGEPVVRPMRKVAIGLTLTLAGALMMATINVTADLLLPARMD